MTGEGAGGVGFLADPRRVLGRASDTRVDVPFSPAGDGLLGEDGSGGKKKKIGVVEMRGVGLFIH